MDQLRIDSQLLHPELKIIQRDTVTDSFNTPRITTEYFTKYEYTSLIAIRAQQLADGAKPLVSLDGILTSSPTFIWDVAKREIHERKLPYIIHRRMPNGVSEYWNAAELGVIW